MNHAVNRLTYRAVLTALALSVGMPLARVQAAANPDPYHIS
ncbi:MAG: hypothetical protein WCS43_17355 [Verrucomicrobiota bacterium]